MTRNLLKHLQQLPGHRILGHGEAGDIAAGARQAGDEAGADRIGNLRENDRDAAGLQQQRLQRQRGDDKNHIRIETHKLFRVGVDAPGVGAAPTKVDADVAAVGPTQLLQRLPERRDIGLHFRIALDERVEQANPAHALALLRADRKRPRSSRAAEQRDELASSHRLRSQDGQTLTTMASGHKIIRPASPASHVGFRQLRTLVRASNRWSSRPTLLSERG
jgi:hypothetical protein